MIWYKNEASEEPLHKGQVAAGLVRTSVRLCFTAPTHVTTNNIAGRFSETTRRLPTSSGVWCLVSVMGIVHNVNKLVTLALALCKSPYCRVNPEREFSNTCYERTRSSAPGNCSAKSLAALVISSILPCSSILNCPS